MRKNYLLAAAGVVSAIAMNAAAPEGDLFILGLNGVTVPDASNTLVMQERSEDDIDEESGAGPSTRSIFSRPKDRLQCPTANP